MDFHVEARSSAPPEAVWPLLADARGWPKWARFTKAELEREGSPTPDGVGAIRRFGSGPKMSREEVVEFVRPHRLVYRLLSGMAIKDYRAVVELTPDDDGTKITWDSTFEPKVPGTGWFYRSFLRWFLTDTAERLAKAAETEPQPG